MGNVLHRDLTPPISRSAESKWCDYEYVNVGSLLPAMRLFPSRLGDVVQG